MRDKLGLICTFYHVLEVHSYAHSTLRYVFFAIYAKAKKNTSN